MDSGRIGASLEVHGVKKEFASVTGASTAVLGSVSLAARAGEFVAIVGPSGCGKTTFLRILDGLIEADAGEVLIDGRPEPTPGAKRGFVFQSDSLLPWRTVAGNVAYGLEIRGVPKPERRAIADDLVALVGLRGFERHYPHQLSGGMRQRVNLARALAVDPQVLLMDEPFASLDAQTRELMQHELLRVWAERRKTVVFITHQIDEAIYLADRVVVFSRRPAVVREIVEIALPRPRPLELKRQAAFVEYVDQIWRLIDRESRALHSLAQ